MADYKYTSATPVDEPVVKPTKATKVNKPKPEPKSAMYPDSVPVDEPVKKMAKGGSASARADGIAIKGKTRGTMIMCGGGMAGGRK
jgi:hypothetical protein